MISPQEIRTVTFDKIMRGYRPEDVDAFLQQVAQDMEQLANDNAEKEKKLYILAEKIEEYRRDEDNLKTALLNAQRMGENVIREAKQKAEAILRETSIRADTLTRVANEQVDEQKEELVRLKAEIVRFKNDILGMYKKHIELLSDLPDDDNAVEEPLAPILEEKVAESQVETKEEPVEAITMAEEEVEPAVESVEVETSVLVEESENSQFPDLAELYSEKESVPSEEKIEDDSDDFLSVNEEDDFLNTIFAKKSMKSEEAPQNPSAEKNTFQGFKGIKFSD